MRRIAIALDRGTLDLLDRMQRSSPTHFRSRSAVIRAAICFYALDLERRVIRENRWLLDVQLRALVEEAANL